ncbi:hypothetical protein IJ670_00755 [bacterium]|nr:hypothetical protein [bacterium]
MINNLSRTQLYSNFEKSNDLSNKSYFTNLYSKEKPQYYDKNDIKIKKNSNIKSKIPFIVLGTSVLSAIVGSLILTRKLDVQRAAKSIKELELGSKIVNIMTNLNNIKDDYWKLFTTKLKKTPLFFLDKLGEKYTNFYTFLSKNFNPLKSRYEKAYNKVVELGGKNFEGVVEYEKYFNELNSGVIEEFSEGKPRLTKNLFKNGLSGENGLFKRLVKSNIASERLNSVFENSAKPAVYEGNSVELKKATDEFNKIKLETTKLLGPKLRDVNLGQAPTDFINQVIVPTSALLIALKNSKSKEEKKNTMFNLGIPILTTLGFTQVGNVLSISGLTSLVFGLTTSQLVVFALKAIQKHKQNLAQKNTAQQI